MLLSQVPAKHPCDSVEDWLRAVDNAQSLQDEAKTFAQPSFSPAWWMNHSGLIFFYLEARYITKNILGI